MNFSRAVKGHLTRTGAIRAIHSQAETELGRVLSKEEESLLFAKTDPSDLQAQIEKVYRSCFNEFVVTSIIFSMDMATSNSSCFCLRDPKCCVRFLQPLPQEMGTAFFMVSTCNHTLLTFDLQLIQFQQFLKAFSTMML